MQNAVAAYHGSQYTETRLNLPGPGIKQGISMVIATTQRPLVFLTLPRSPVARLAAQALVALAGSLLLIASAKTKLVLGPVDMSLQTLAVLVIGAGFGLRLGVATVLLYLGQGLAGFPVFQSSPEQGIGLAYMAGPTGGYLLGFVAMAAIVGWAADRGWDRSVTRLLAACLCAELVMMALGFGWLAGLIGPDKAWQFGVAPFIVPDLVKLALASALVPAIWSIVTKRA